MTDITKIKLSISCWYFPKWYESGYSHGKVQTIEIEIQDFRSISTLIKKEPPYQNTYLILVDNNLQGLYNDLFNLILNKYENVGTISMDPYSQKIYTQDFLKETENWKEIFNIPPGENNSAVHKKKDYSKYFDRTVFTGVCKEKKPFYSQYIGYTSRTNEELKNGVELKCELIFETGSTYKIEYIYIRGITKLQKDWRTGPVSEYYIIPKDFIDQVNSEFEKILIKNSPIKEIKVGYKLFDDSILQFNESKQDNYKFEKKIEYYYTLVYKKETGTELKKQAKEKHQTFIESARSGRSNLSYEELEAKYWYLDHDNDRNIDDFRADFYSNF